MTLRLGFCLALLLFGWLPAHAQELVNSAPETNVSERVRLLESELERRVRDGAPIIHDRTRRIDD